MPLHDRRGRSGPAGAGGGLNAIGGAEHRQINIVLPVHRPTGPSRFVVAEAGLEEGQGIVGGGEAPAPAAGRCVEPAVAVLRAGRPSGGYASGRACNHTDRRSTTDCRSFQTNIREAVFATPIREGSGLFVGPAMALETPGPSVGSPLQGDQTTTGEEQAAHLSKPDLNVGPVVHRGNRPYGRSGPIRHRDRLSGTFDVVHLCRGPGEESRDPQHDGRRINPGC